MKTFPICIWLWWAVWSWTFSAHGDLFPHHYKWRQLESAHFTVIYNEPNKALAEVYAAAAEKAYAQLNPLFGDPPPLPIPILIADRTDLANGSATFLPYALIVAYPVLPDSGDSISHYENWAYELILHELTHLFTFAPVHGFYKPLQYIFGNVIRPNGILPRWYMEGLAVEMESRYTTHGRLRSPNTQAALRALTLSDFWKRETVDYINESSIPSWPFGQRPYLFGALIWHDLAEEGGTKDVNEMNQRFSRRLPFLLNGVFEDFGELDVEQRWNKLKSELQRQTQAQIQQVQQAGGMTQTAFKNESAQQILPTISPNGEHLVYLTSPKFESSTLQLVSRPMPVQSSFSSHQAKALTEVLAVTRIAWMPDSKSILFDQLAIHQRHLRFRDLYLLNLSAPEKPQRLSWGLRASQPHVSPSGRDVVFVRTLPGRNELALMNLATRKVKTILRPKWGFSVEQPTFLDEHSLAFVGRNDKGSERLYRLDLKTLKRKPMVNFAESFSQVRSTPKGLLVAAHVGQNSNLYLVKGDNSAAQALTNTSTEILQGDYDFARQEILFSQLTGEGRKLFVSAVKNHQPPRFQTLPALEFKNDSGTHAPMTKVATKDEDYSVWPYMVPRYWIPFIYPVESGILFQGTTSTMDPTERHGYGVSGSYDSVTKQTSYGLRYDNRTLPVSLGFNLAETNELLASQSQRITNRIYGVDSSFNPPGLSDAWSAGLHLTQIESEIPATTGSRSIERLGVGALLGYNSSSETLVKPGWGEYFFSAGHTSFMGAGERLGYERSTGQIGTRVRGPLPARHSILLQAKGAYSAGLQLNNLVALGDRTIGGNYLVSLVNSNYLLRGYPSGALVGRTLINTNLEYRFPMSDIFRGKGTFPVFLRGLEGAVFVDSALVDGAYFSPESEAFFRSRTDDIFTGTGLEFTLSGTAAYHLPVTMTLGLYYGLDDRAGGGFLPFLSLGYVGHGGVDGSSVNSTRLRPASLAR
ncbi:MAG: hypothetical protein AB7K41_03335 [Bdellovibrionales bacterium]